MAKKQDSKTLELIAEVKKRKAEIAKLEKPNWLTNCTFSYIEGSASGVVNLHVEGSVKNLIGYAGFLRDKEASYAEAAASLGIDNPPAFTWATYSVADWLEDIKTRINKIQIASKRKSLEVLEGRLNAIISPELRAELELQAIADELS